MHVLVKHVPPDFSSLGLRVMARTRRLREQIDALAAAVGKAQAQAAADERAAKADERAAKADERAARMETEVALLKTSIATSPNPLKYILSLTLPISGSYIT